MKSQSPFGPSQFFKGHFQAVNVLGMDTVDARTSNLIQLTDLLTGHVYGAMTNTITNLTKVEISDYLKYKLGVNDLQVGTTVINKFTVL